MMECSGGVCRLPTTTHGGDDLARSVRYLTEFRNQLILFLDELIQQFPAETDLIIARIFLKDQVSMEDVLGRFIRDILPHKDKVVNRDANFFLEHSILYSGAATNKVDHFQNLWRSDRLDAQDRLTVWRWMDVFMRIAERYFDRYGYVAGWEPQPTAVFH